VKIWFAVTLAGAVSEVFASLVALPAVAATVAGSPRRPASEPLE